MASKKLIYPAADRNKEPILQLLRSYMCQMMEDRRFLEISSGSGQHVAHFAPCFPNTMFYPSELEAHLLDSIEAHTHGMRNVAKPVLVDITTDFSTWPSSEFRAGSFDFMYNANLMHISPWKCSEGLFQNAGKLLKDKGLLFTYGPYAEDGKLVPDSNVRFDRDLKSRDPEWGIRDIKDLKKLAEANGIELLKMHDMPANNRTLIWQKLERQS